jgi:hypothetical protein
MIFPYHFRTGFEYHFRAIQPLLVSIPRCFSACSAQAAAKHLGERSRIINSLRRKLPTAVRTPLAKASPTAIALTSLPGIIGIQSQENRSIYRQFDV